MNNIQIEKLLLFYFLYNGADRSCDLPTQSPDYLMEKWTKLIDIPGNDIKYPELKESKLYLDWSSRWLKGKKNIIPDNIMMFLVKTHPKEREGRYCQFMELCDMFQTYITKTSDITQETYNHIHPLFLESIKDIIKRTVSKEDLREIIINNMLS